MQTLFINIKELLQVRENSIEKVSGKEMATLPKIDNAYLLIENNLIADFGPMDNCPIISDAKVIDATGQVILPTWVDSHTHIVYMQETEYKSLLIVSMVYRMKKLLIVEVGF